MRNQPRNQNAGFTLLEMVLAMACSALIVSLLVSVWVQVMKTSMDSAQEAASARKKAEEHAMVWRMFRTVQWTSTSLKADGVFPWRDEPGRLAIWSGDSEGQAPGPVRWTLTPGADGMRVEWADPDGVGATPRKWIWPDIVLVRMDVLVATPAGDLDWVRIVELSQDSSFHPFGFRLRIQWRGQAGEEDLEWMT